MTHHATDAVRTSAHQAEPDMFGLPDVPCAPGAPLLQLSGVLLEDACVRTKLVDGGQHSLPVLCIEVAPLSKLGHSLHAEQVYTEATRKLAEDRAAALRKGTRITLTTPLAGMRVFLPHVQSVDLKP